MSPRCHGRPRQVWTRTNRYRLFRNISSPSLLFKTTRSTTTITTIIKAYHHLHISSKRQSLSSGKKNITT
ncbi:hypothetical protein E2C01_089628 [Portunus trituberculatus]|uniref:Uncharacterized protein n=1 Tax=Portunus trituberculatus TaxID=210409 RepID=A0A5B7JMY5_PORTR|nr:hypothetical protein [Portunus trituberculatus]